MRIRSIVILLSGAAIFPGCYTQFSTLNQDRPSFQETVVVDSTGDTVKIRREVDTVVTKEREICVWERDLLGYPRLRCYNTYYPRDWVYYNNSPWWYRNDPYWYDYDRCPRYYYYDAAYGRCRYYKDNPRYYNPGSGGSGGGGSGSSSGPAPRTRSDGVPGSSATSGSQNQLPKSGEQGIIETPAPQRVAPRTRSSGVPGSSAAPVDEKQKGSSTGSVTPPPQPQSNPQAVPAMPKSGFNTDTTIVPQRNGRRNPRSW